ncbi:aldehyde dehydrogenase family protein [Lichenicoccus sp.]|uniref:aldehyde dehydrogenase family protein n=1 Tax=Lichenicoccus sp. TaxID=2781899 RepID=UPI003D0CE296
MTGHLQHSLLLQKRAVLREPVPGAAPRRAALAGLERLLRGNAGRLQRAVMADFGNRAHPETVLAEILPLLDAIVYARARVAGWMRPQRVPVGLRFQPGQAWVEMRPVGCVGIVSPWNYPFLLSLQPVIDALAAGCRVMLKPSELSPACADLLATLLAEVFDPEDVAVMQGDAAMARAFCALEFDHLLFTGSTGVGREVMQSAARNLVPVTLELGGKSPAILCPDRVATDAARRRTAHSLAVGKFFNAGQTCLAPDYVLAPRAHLAATAEALAEAARRLYPSILDNPDYTGLISNRHQDRLLGLVADAAQRGLAILRHPDDRADRQGLLRAQRRLPPTVVMFPDLAATATETAMMQEEIFGPVLPVLPYDSVEQAAAFVNARPVPLALYCYTDDRAQQRHVLDTTRSGGVTLNGTLLHCAQPGLPFGGLGHSGTGAYHGHAGFLRFSHRRAIYRPGRFSGFTWMTPPHGAMTRRALTLMLGRKPQA